MSLLVPNYASGFRCQQFELKRIHASPGIASGRHMYLRNGTGLWQAGWMSLSEIQKEAGALSSGERRKLAAFLTALRMKETGEWEEATRAGTSNRSEWISLEEAKQRLLGTE